MGNIRDIIELAKDLESRAKDRKDIDTLREIISLTHSIQSHDAEVVEKNLELLTENHQLKLAMESLKQGHTQAITQLQEKHRAEISQMTAATPPPQAEGLDEGCQRMLVFIAHTDGITREAIIRWMGLEKVKGEYMFDQLFNRKFIKAGSVGGPQGFPFHVTPCGRDYMSKASLLDVKPDRPRPQPPPSRSAGFGQRRMF